MSQDPYRYFRLEARELLDQCGQSVLDLENGGAPAPLVQRLLRLAHTLKGAARVVRQAEIADHAHAMEDVLSPLRDTAGPVARTSIEAVLARLKAIGALLPGLAVRDPAEAPRLARPAAEEETRTVRADLAEMDAVLDGVSETHALVGNLRGTASGIEQAQHLVDLLLAQLAPGRQRGAVPADGSLDRTQAIAEQLRRRFGGIARTLEQTLDQMDRELHQLRDAAERLRLAPVGSLFAVLERTARDTAETLAKRVVFIGTGAELRLDSHVLGAVQAALIQIVRNAVAHGIEPADERRRAGKPEAGRIEVSVTRRGQNFAFECRDDGRGVDFEAVRRAALNCGLARAEVQSLDAAALMRLLLQGGVSTAGAVTPVAGRGVGLDIVRDALDRLGGEVAIRTEPGRGTVLELIVPASLAAMEALLVEVGAERLAVPLDAVRRTLRLGAGDVARAAAGTAAVFDGRAIAFMPLAKLLGAGAWPDGRAWTALVVESKKGQAAIGIDRLLGTARIVVRPLPPQAACGEAVAGATLDAEGNPMLVLDAEGLVAAVVSAAAGLPDAAPARRKVLVIDDSLTTRMLEQSILESAGYEVDVAISAEEGLEAARREPYALFLVDVEMPGMDGFAFVERVRADPGLHHVPAILVTSRNAPEDRRRGRDAGAQGYVVKSEFDQAALLSLIRPLVE
jgi:two-component system chemotaxis sensor kinase CheA